MFISSLRTSSSSSSPTDGTQSFCWIQGVIKAVDKAREEVVVDDSTGMCTMYDPHRDKALPSLFEGLSPGQVLSATGIPDEDGRRFHVYNVFVVEGDEVVLKDLWTLEVSGTAIA